MLTTHPASHNTLGSAINDIVSELGTGPKGSEASLTARLAAWAAADTQFAATDKILGRATAGAGAGEEITCTAAGRALLDDATAADQRTTLSLGTMSTQNANNVAVTGGTIGIDDGAAATPSLFLKNATTSGFYKSSTSSIGMTISGVTAAILSGLALTVQRFGNIPALSLRRANTSESAPTRVLADQSIADIKFSSYYDDLAGNAGYDTCAQITASAAEENVGPSNNGSYLEFATTATGTSTLTNQLRLDNSGRLVLASRNGHTGFTAGTVGPRLQGYASTVQGAALGSTTFANSATAGGSLYLGHMRGTSAGGFTAVSTGDILGRIAAEGADGTDMAQAVVLRFKCEGTIAANQVPGLFELHTANASGTLTQALTVNSSQTCTVLGTTDSTTKDTGALICEGGVGVEKSVVAGIGLNAANKFRIHYDSSTGEWGPQAKLTNKTGGNTVKGQIVIASTGTDMAFNTAPISSDAPIGVIYEAGVADASDAWVWMAGATCQVLIKDGTTSTRGYWASVSDTAGRADITNAAPVPATHPQEIGHCLESKGSGTSVLARISLHFQ